MPLEVEGRTITCTTMHTCVSVKVLVHDSVLNKDRVVEALITRGGGVVLPALKGKGKALLLSSATRLADLYAAVEEAVTDNSNRHVDAEGEKNRAIVYATLTRALGLGKRAMAHTNNGSSTSPVMTLLLPNSDALKKKAITDDEAATVDAYCESLFGVEGRPIEDDEVKRRQSPTSGMQEPLSLSYLATLGITVAVVRRARDECEGAHTAREVYTSPCVGKEMIDTTSKRAQSNDHSGITKDDDGGRRWTLVSSRLMNNGVSHEALRHASRTGRKAVCGALTGLKFPNLVNTSEVPTNLPPDLADSIRNLPAQQRGSLMALLRIGSIYYGSDGHVNPSEDDEEPTSETLLLQLSVLRVFV